MVRMAKTNATTATTTTMLKRSYSIHKVRELQLPEVALDNDYELLELIGEGCYGKVYLADHRKSGSRIALKAVAKDRTRLRDFLHEFHYSYFLSPHRHVLISYDVAFQTDSYYMFAQEYAPQGDLAKLLDGHSTSTTAAATSVRWLATDDEEAIKSVCHQVASALEFMHSKQLVHGDVRPQNVLVFDGHRLVKLTDFGLTRPAGTLVKKTNLCPAAYMPPEICDALYNEGFTIETSSDVWQLAVLVCVCLRRRLPWQRAHVTDAQYGEYLQWQKRKTMRTPSAFVTFSPRLLRMLRRMLEPKQTNRATVKELSKYLNDRWLVKRWSQYDHQHHQQHQHQNQHQQQHQLQHQHQQGKERRVGVDVNVNVKGVGVDIGLGDDNSVVKFRDTWKEHLARQLTSYGIETTIDYEAKRNRIKEWVLTAPPSE